MLQPAAGESAIDSFAGVLASLGVRPKSPALPWDDQLADDVATISYEQALRSHSRRDRSEIEVCELRHDPSGAETALPETVSATEDSATFFAPARNQASPKGRMKSASITIRLSEDECAQLRRRASEAGITVSAYLRSCAFEVETLRAQVKEAIAQMRAASPVVAAAPAPSKHPADTGRWNWRSLLLFRKQGGMSVPPR
jgi:predicted DNA binding CopG/RHH family protein